MHKIPRLLERVTALLLVTAGISVGVLVFETPAAGQGTLSAQVLRLLTRANTWSAVQTFTVSPVFTAAPTLTEVTVSTLPTCNSGSKGLVSAVSDATAPTYLGTLTGSGTVHTPVYCNGTAWVSF